MKIMTEKMTSCLLCLEQITQSEEIKISNEIIQNFSIKDAIVDYFKCSETILESQLKYICSICYKNLENFHIFATKVNNIYNNYEDPTVFCSRQGSREKQNSQETIDNSNESFIDDIIEYDEAGSIEFEDRLSDQEQIEPKVYESSENLTESGILKINSNDLQTQNALILPKNFIKISQKNFKFFSTEILQNETKINFQMEVGPKNNFSEFSTSSDRKTQDKPQNSTKSPKNLNPNLKLISKNHQKIQITKNLKNIPQKCEICIKTFKTAAILKTHIQKIHSDTQNTSICKECGKAFTNKYILKTHMRKHIVDSDKSYECYICKKSSKNLPHLLDHFKYKHDPAYSTSSVCHICSKTVTRLDIHLRQMHSNDPIERVKCEICGHFMKKSSLRGHLASHYETGFNCEACGKYLKNRNSYLCHMKRVHTTGKYKCDHCDKAFHQESRLIDHIACQHTRVFLHKCRIAECEKKFRNAGRRRMHERRMHPVDYERNFKASYLREHLEFQ